MELIPREKVEGTVQGLKRKDLDSGKVLVFDWEPDLSYAWDDGPAIARYLAELKNGKIIAKKCNKCHRVMIPPRMFLELGH